jgi:hypothetical protein
MPLAFRWSDSASRFLCVTAAAVALVALRAQSPAPAARASDEYLLLGDATRAAGEPMIAADPTTARWNSADQRVEMF